MYCHCLFSALKVQEEIIVLLATSLTLLFMIQQISPDWVSQHVFDQSWQEQLTKWLPKKMDKLINWSLISGTKNKGTSQWSKMMTFYQRKEKEYKWTSDMLELGHCWALVAARMLDLG
jgi:hypothetical protein